VTDCLIGLNRVVEVLPQALAAWTETPIQVVGIGLVQAAPEHVDQHAVIIDFDQLTDVVVTSPMAAQGADGCTESTLATMACRYSFLGCWSEYCRCIATRPSR